MRSAINLGSNNVSDETNLVHGGRNPAEHKGFVNTPIYRGSTVVFNSLAELDDYNIQYRYGRQGTPLTTDLETLISDLESAAGTFLTPSGVSAICCALLACVKTGDDLLITDSVYEPTRSFADGILKSLGVTTRYFDPYASTDIAELILPNTAAIFLESPGSLTFEVQDIPAICEAARSKNVKVIVDNSWATPLFFKPLSHGADIVIHSGTKMFAGHSDLLIGTVSANSTTLDALQKTHRSLGLIASPDDAFLTLRGMRTLSIRMKEHESRALELAEWLASHAAVKRVLHPALSSHPQHNLFKRDFSGSGSLFSFTLPAAPRHAVAAFVDEMELFKMGYSWGGYESLILPSDPKRIRTATPWTSDENLFRIHAGFENTEELKDDLSKGIERYLKSAGI